MWMKLNHDHAIVSISKLEAHGRSFILGELLNAVQGKDPPITQPQGKRPGIAPEIKPPETHPWLGLHLHKPEHRLLDYRYKC